MKRIVGLLAVLLGSAAGDASGIQQDYDVIVRNGRVLDGTGNPWAYADVGISGDRVAFVGDLSDASAARVIDAAGLYVAPGFIDVHSHAGPGLARSDLSAGQPLLAQGLTTVLVNPDGGGPVDLAEQRSELLEHGLGVNVALLVPHGSVRGRVLGMEDRAPEPAELDEMRRLVRAGMEEGAFGLSSGPFYAPGSYADTQELIELAKAAAEYGGAYTSHIRDESDYTIGLIAAVDEVIEVSRQAGLPGVVTHVKALGPRVWGYSRAVAHRIDRAREEGLEIYADQYPYEASQTGLVPALVPRWAQEGGQAALDERLSDAELWPRIRDEMVDNLDRRGGAARIQIGRYRDDPSFEGKTLQEIADEHGMDPIDMARELVRGGGPSIVSFNMHDDDIETLMRQPWTITSSDGDLGPLGEGQPHPRAYGAFSRKIRKYVVEERVVDLAAAIRSMTSLPAAAFRLEDRGVLRAGAIADVVVFDLEQVRDLATYEDPHQLSEGMIHVLVNGEPAIQDGQLTGGLHGRVLSGQERTVSAATP